MASIHEDAPDNGRRNGDRRRAQLPIDGPDRRKGDRRSGTDRREEERRKYRK